MQTSLETSQGLLNEQISELIAFNKKLQKEIFQHKLVEQKLRTFELKMRSIFATSDIILIIKVADEELTNLEILSTDGCGEESYFDLIDQTVELFFQEDTAHKCLEKVKQVLKTQEKVDFDYSICLEEKEFWFNTLITPITEDSVLWIARDITARKKVEFALQESEERKRKKAEELQLTLSKLQHTQSQLIFSEKMASLGQLVAGIAHEINNPTTFIYSNIKPAYEYMESLLNLAFLYQKHYPNPAEEIIQTIEDIDLDFVAEDFPKLLKSIEQGAKRTSVIVNSLRKFSCHDEANIKRADVHEGINNTLIILNNNLKKTSLRPEIEVIKEYGKLPEINCCPSQLNQVFLNVISNAINAIDESFLNNQKLLAKDFGQIRIRTHVVESSIEISIADNGSGINSEILPKIFDPFFTTKAPGKGTGLGLSISYKIVVEEHGGEMVCNSQVGQGTELVILLPIFSS